MAKKKKKYRATFVKREKWWIAWSDDVPGAQTQGKTLEEARENLKDAIALMLQEVDLEQLLGDQRIVYEEIEV